MVLHSSQTLSAFSRPVLLLISFWSVKSVKMSTVPAGVQGHLNSGHMVAGFTYGQGMFS